MGYLDGISHLISSRAPNQILLGYSKKTQSIAEKLAQHYSVLHEHIALQAIDNLIDQVDKIKSNVSIEDFSEAIIHSYTIKNIRYPQRFDTYIAMQYLDKKNRDTEQPNKLATSPQWFKQKSEEVENHLKHITLMKLQLTKNLKDLQSQYGRHLWIDIDFIDPATETLQASLTQVQDLENRLQVLKLTYQDYV